MSATPRRGTGAFPQTPGTIRGKGAPPTPASTPPPGSANSSTATWRGPSTKSSPLPLAPQQTTSRTAASQPVIPTTILDAPTQRFYAVALYIALLAWRLYDWAQLVEEETGSLGLFLKWEVIDLLFFFGLPEMRIPWLELTQTATTTLFAGHSALNFVLMFRIPIPLLSWLAGFVKVFYDREISITEQYVKVSNVMYNSSLIMGRQIINILPEGSAILNQEGASFCLGGGIQSVAIPMQFNATNPIEIELIRTDLDTNIDEVVKIGYKELREIQRHTRRQAADPEEPVVKVSHSVKKPGVYRLGKVLDEYKLEVQRQNQPTYVVPCPSARVVAVPSKKRCLGDLSDLSLEVQGTPPLQIHYSRTINGRDAGFHFQSLQPDGFSSPLVGSNRASSLILPDNEDVSWARSQSVKVSLNESMNAGGDWQFSIDKVVDVFGNEVEYPSPADDPDAKPKPAHLVQDFKVQERPRASVRDYGIGHPLKLGKGMPHALPVKVDIKGSKSFVPVKVEWQFSPLDTLTRNGDHGSVISYSKHTAQNARDWPGISATGLYTLKSVSADSCEGEIQEPASFLLLNPLEPSFQIQSEEISDQCAGQSTGIRVNFDFVGTPPFEAHYTHHHESRKIERTFKTNSARAQLDLLPPVAGTHRYVFDAVSDAVYVNVPLRDPNLKLETTVRPQATAKIVKPQKQVSACLDDEVAVDIALYGEAPFTLEWELVHNGKRKSHKSSDIQRDNFAVKTPSLSQGGDYMLTLIAVKDKSGCRNFLKDELRITTRRQRPSGAFGLMDGKLRTTTVADAKARLPLRLTGTAPWTLTYQMLGEGGAKSGPITREFKNENDVLEVTQRGTYELLSLSDSQCPGSVNEKLSQFEVSWYPRPHFNIVPTESLTTRGGKYHKNDICEGDIDGFELGLSGAPPYHVEYTVIHQGPSGGPGTSPKRELDVALDKASIQMDTARPGLYTYSFSSLADNLYDHDKRAKPLVVEQRVNANPSVSFVKPGQVFKMCMSDQEAGEVIPIKLDGVAPFNVEIEIKHQSGGALETYHIPSINSNKFDLKIPRQYLKLGSQQVRIRKVRDARGCQSRTENGGAAVQVHLYDAPAIYPLETRTDYCVGERIAYTLSGTPPFQVSYTFDGVSRKAKSTTTNFRRIAEQPGDFTLTSISDRASECTASVNITKTIHPMPSVRISKGKNVQVDIHEGGEVDIVFEFGGTPPFEFTYTRSSNAKKGSVKGGQVLETRHDVSYEYSKVIRANQEGTYEVVAIKDSYCAFSTLGAGNGGGGDGQKLLPY